MRSTAQRRYTGKSVDTSGEGRRFTARLRGQSESYERYDRSFPLSVLLPRRGTD